MHADNEIKALNDVYENLKGLDHAQIKRILAWVKDKFALEKQPHLKAVEREAASTPAVSVPVEAAKPAAAPVKKKRGRPPAKTKTPVKPIKKRRGRPPAKKEPEAKKEPVKKEPADQPAVSPVIQRFHKYDNFEDLLLFSSAYNNTAKVLLAAAYLQVRKNLNEFGGNDIISLFIEVGEEINEVSPFLITLMSKTPPLMIQTGTEGQGLEAKGKFRVTEEGLQIAVNYIR